MKKDKILQGKEKDIANIEFSLEEGVEQGFIVRKGIKDGQRAYEISDKGKAFVEAMPFESEREKELWLENWDLKSLLSQKKIGKDRV